MDASSGNRRNLTQAPGIRRFAGFHRGALLVLAAAAFSLLPEPAAAQDCGNWSRPVLCTAELVATDADRRALEVSGRSGIVLAPREQIFFELVGRDQAGRRFPAEWLALGYNDRNCGSILTVESLGEGQLRVSASASGGRCRLEIWVPNNLNFFWDIDIEVSAAARSGYSRSEAVVVVNALYQAILAREPDAGSFNSAVAEVQAGNLDTLVTSMFRSSEFREKSAGVNPATLLEQFYQGILGRESDSAGVRLYQAEMRRGQYSSVLLKLIRSPEFERRLEGQ
jgi:hypothetical protein